MTDATNSAIPRAGTKSQRLLEMLKTGTGASLDKMVEATGWQAHTVRAAMTGIRKRGHAISRHVDPVSGAEGCRPAGG